MDISRFFHLQWQPAVSKDDGSIEKPGFHFLVMQSEFEGEFGIIRHRIVAQLEGEFKLSTLFLETSGEKPDSLFSFRSAELFYFVTKILPLFNPLTHIPNEVPFPSSSQSQNP